MKPPPGGLVDGQRRPRVLRIAGAVDWYLADRNRFERLGSGDLSMQDIQAVQADLGVADGSKAVFVCVSRPKEIEEILGQGRGARWGTRRITWSTRLGEPIAPSRGAVARGARVALLPGRGLVWVDGERLFSRDETVPLPWTDPLVELAVVRPREVRRALRQAVGAKGPRRAALPPE
jgi:hypothetical protein